MYNIVTMLFTKWEKAASEDIPDKKRLMIIVALTVFYHLHFPKINKKLIKNVWNSHKKVGYCPKKESECGSLGGSFPSDGGYVVVSLRVHAKGSVRSQEPCGQEESANHQRL